MLSLLFSNSNISFNLKRWILLSLVTLVSLTDATGQVDRSGFIFGIGIGSGYSKHAGSYSIVRSTSLGKSEEYSGFRILAADLKVGWGFARRAQVYYTFKYSPANSTISPYQSLYQGVALAYSPKSLELFIISVGAGINNTRDRNEKLGKGTMANFALGYEINPHFLLEVNTIFGKMENTPPPSTLLDTSNEFAFYITFTYLFYRDPIN